MQNMHMGAEKQPWCLLCHSWTQARSLGVCAKAGVRVCANLAIATEVRTLQEKIFIWAVSVPSARSNKPCSPPFFLHPSTIPLPTPCHDSPSLVLTWWGW